MKMPEYKQIERIIRIMQRLALKREITVKELYNHFDGLISKRTIERDLEHLSMANIPLCTRKGRGRELIWYLDEKYKHFIPQTIGVKELNASLLLGNFMDMFKGTSLEKDAKSFLKKAKQIYDPEIIINFDNVSQTVFGFSTIGRIDFSKYSAQIEALISAIRNRYFCNIEYKGYSHKKPYITKVEPYLILIHKGALYAVVYSVSMKKYIYLLIHRMISVDVANEKYKKRKDFNHDNLAKDSIGIFSNPDLKPTNVRLKFSPDIAETIADRIWHPSQKIQRHKNGSLTLCMKVVISDELLGWISSWRHYVEVLGPEKLAKNRGFSVQKSK